MAPNGRFGLKADIALASLSLRPVLAQSRHRSGTDKCMLWVAADIGAARSGSRSVATEVPNANCLKKKVRVDGRGTVGDPDRVNEAQNVGAL